jgi:hypothetical protein
MTKWLEKGTEPSLPLAPNHQVGSAGLVFSPDGRILVVQEKSGPSVRFPDFWKLPGGLVDPGEDISAGTYAYMYPYVCLDVPTVCLHAHPMHPCAYVCPHVLTYAHMCLRMPTCAYVCPHVLTYAHMCLRMPTCAYVCPHVLTYAHMCLRMPTCAYVCPHVLTYAYMCLRMPTCAYVCLHGPTCLPYSSVLALAIPSSQPLRSG